MNPLGMGRGRRPGLAALAAAALAATTWAACGGGTEPESRAPAATEAAVDPATAGSVSGTVRLEGTPPAPQPIIMATEPQCLRENPRATTETFLVGSEGALQNVFVYVKDGLGNRVFPAPATPVVLDQRGCVYRPRVFGIQVGQPLEILNSDPLLHNIHAMPEVNQEFNRGQGIRGQRDTHVFSAREVMVPFKCDVHRWMTAWVGVLDHPFYSVTAADGAFRLEGLPPGTYTIEAWHEELGTETQSVTIGERENTDVGFTFRI